MYEDIEHLKDKLSRRFGATLSKQSIKHLAHLLDLAHDQGYDAGRKEAHDEAISARMVVVVDENELDAAMDPPVSDDASFIYDEDADLLDDMPPPFHKECGHFHIEGDGCPARDEPCGSYLCCIN